MVSISMFELPYRLGAWPRIDKGASPLVPSCTYNAIFQPPLHRVLAFYAILGQPPKYFYLFLGRYFYSFFRIILIFFFLCGTNILLLAGKPAMIMWKTSELAGRKGVRSGSKGGSISEVIPSWICRPMSELNQNFLPFSQFT
jgi:hypothetical protein